MTASGQTLHTFEAMGTRFECVLAGFDRAVGPSHAIAAAEEAERLVREWHVLLTAFGTTSVVSQINSAAGSDPVRVCDELRELLERCQRYAEDTHGAFDITLGSLMAKRGFRSDDEGLEAWGIDALMLDEQRGTASLVRPGVRLDLGGVAKGFALDLCAEELRDLGVTSALLHGGTSSAIAIGHRPDGAPWRIRFNSAGSDGPEIELADSAMSVSEPRGRISNGAGHILDPRNGNSADSVSLACVFGPSAEVCEVWSTAVVVDPSLIDKLPIDYGAHALVGERWLSSQRQATCA